MGSSSFFFILSCCPLFAGAIKDIDSHEEAISKDSDKAPQKRMEGPAGQMDITSGKASEQSPGKRISESSVEQVDQRSYVVVDGRRKATPGFDVKVSADRSRELQDLDSVEDEAGRTAPLTNHRQENDYEGQNLPTHYCSRYSWDIIK